METGKHNKLQFRIDLVLTVLFILSIFFALFANIVFGHGLWGHIAYRKYVAEYLEDPDDYTPLEWVLAARTSLDNFIAGNLYGSDKLGKVNSAFQYALGKKLVSTGGTQMIRLNTGHLYDLQSEMSMEPALESILSMQSSIPEGTPFLFVYEHHVLYDEEAQMPAGYEFLDFSNQEADEVLRLARENGIESIDSREVFRASGLTLDEFLMRTDQHWSTRAALTVTQEIAERVGELTGADVHPERLDIDQFDTKVYPKLFLGKYGQRVGTALIDPDDMTVYMPKYDTNIHRLTFKNGEYTDVEGPFEEVNIRWEVLNGEDGKSWTTKAYHDYGLVEGYEIFHNEAGADCTILLVKDSYSAPIGRFLSLVAKDVYSVDLRSYTFNNSLPYWIEQSDPDVVILSYCLQMLRNELPDFE